MKNIKYLYTNLKKCGIINVTYALIPRKGRYEMKKQIIAALLAMATLIGVAACTKDPAGPTDTTEEFTTEGSENSTTDQDSAGDISLEKANSTDIKVSSLSLKKSEGIGGFSKISYTTGDPYFSLKEADSDGSKVTLRSRTVSAVRLKRKYDDNTVAKYQFKLHVSEKNPSSAWSTLYIGLRLSSVAGEPTSQSGIWLAVYGNNIGIRTNKWPETSYVKIQEAGVDFSTARMIYIEDDMKNEVVSVFADNDKGEKVAIATVKLEDDKINLYHPDGTEPVLSDTIKSSINDNGYCSVWLHHMTMPVFVSDFAAEGTSTNSAQWETGNMLNSKDVLSDTWVATDDEDRVTGNVGGALGDKKVGIFYFLWHEGSGEIYDHSAAFANGGIEGLKEIVSQGPISFAHYWGQPYFGYYRSDDEWVIRKHTEQLVAAGVDFIFVDATNGFTYKHCYDAILETWAKMRAEGNDTPQIMFHCGVGDNSSNGSFDALWNDLYSCKKYEELWFKHDGKPLIFIPTSLAETLTPEQKDTFTIRQSWAYTKDDWYTDTDGKNCWAWADMYPQSPGKSPEGEVEQMVVMCGFWSNGSFGVQAGRSYTSTKGQPFDRKWSFDLTERGTSGKGLAFQEQFDLALETNPDIIMITGWNEWWAGRWTADVTGAGVGQKIANTYTVTNNGSWSDSYYVDCFSPEFSRDIEPVKGAFNDNYYYQMAMNIREFKGSRLPISAFGQKDIDIAGGSAQWLEVGPEFRDNVGDTAHRNAKSHVGELTYTNTTGRNDFDTCKVSVSGDNVYFYAQCTGKISSPKGTNWMNLFIDADGDHSTGWYGYDFVINRSQDGNTCSIEKFVDNKWEFEKIGDAEYSLDVRNITIKVSAKTLGLGSTFDFKWADNSVADGDIMQFIDLGDTAPNDRFNYRYTSEKSEITTPECLTEDMIVLKAGSYYAYVGGEMVMLNDRSTKATFFGDRKSLYVPKAFAEDTLELDVSSIKVVNHYGVEYVNIFSLIDSCGKTVTQNDRMIVFASAEVSEEDMLTLYRSLY